MCPDGKIKNNCSSWYGKLRARASLQNKNASVILEGTAKKRLMFPGYLCKHFSICTLCKIGPNERRSTRRVSVSSTPTALLWTSCFCGTTQPSEPAMTPAGSVTVVRENFARFWILRSSGNGLAAATRHIRENQREAQLPAESGGAPIA